MKELVEKKSSLIFTNTRPMAEILGSRFRLLDFFPVSVHHGSLSALSRIRAEQGLKSGKIRGVVCTSSLELGIDVGSVELCIQYNSPRQVTRLIQRVGRSGHWIGGTSEGVVVVQDGDDAIESLVIARRAMLEELEPVRIPLVPYDALMHEIAGLLLIRRRWRKDDAFRLVNSASLYRKLTREEFERILRYMQDLQLLRIFEDSFIRGSRRIFSYYYSNLSMIPETKQYLVINDEDELPVGILDEEFLLENDIGTKFIMAGSCWKILQIYKDKVWVVPEDDPEGAIPSWVGEEIPVPFEVAQEVGRIRVEVENGRAKELTKFYPAPEDVIRRSIRDTSAMPCIPTDDRIVVEKWDGYLILHASFGTLVNRTLSRYLSYRISETGEAVSSYHDAYRIYLRTDFEKEKLKNLLIPEKVEEIVKNSIVESKYFKRRFVQVARRMGAIEEEPSPSILDQLLLALRETPVWDEAFKEVVSKDLDLKKTVEILSKIKSGKIDLVIIEGEEPSPLARTGLRSARAESIPKRRRAFMISSVLARILSEVRTFICLKCRIAEEFIVKDAPLRCRKCGSHLGIAEESLEDVERLLDRKEKSFLSQMEKSASLLSKYGRNALLVLSSRVNNAEKILAQEKENDELIEMIIEEERKSLLRRWRG
jgi:ATP-dependent Lhr-like helicase